MGWTGRLANRPVLLPRPRGVKDSARLQARADDPRQCGTAVQDPSAQLPWAAEASPSRLAGTPSPAAFTGTGVDRVCRLRAPTTGAASCRRALLSTAAHSSMQTVEQHQPRCFKQERKSGRSAEGCCERPCTPQPCGPSPCRYTGLFLPRGRRGHCLGPGRSQPCLPRSDLKDRRVYAVAAAGASLGTREGSGASVRGAAWHPPSCPVGSQPCLKRAGWVNPSFC